MKRTFQLIIVVILTTSYLHSQDISINLSIRWNEGPFILKTDSIAKYPELVMSFTNISKDNLCFKKFSYYQFGLADFLYYEIPNFDHNTAKKHINYRKTIQEIIVNDPYKDEKYIVDIKSPNINWGKWEAIREDEWDKEQENALINKKLIIINDYLRDSVYKNADGL